MKPKIFQLNHIAIIFALSIFTLMACKKEKPLEPNEAAGLIQTEHFSGEEGLGGNTGGGNTGGGNNGGGNNGGGNNGGGNTAGVHFTATIDGANKTFPSGSYSDNQMGVIVSGVNSASQESISIMIMAKVIEGDTLQLSNGGMNSATYTVSMTNIYSVQNGMVVFDEITSTYVKGAFYFTAKNNDDNKVATIKDGSFYINR